MVIVPEDTVVAQAHVFQDELWSETLRGLKVTGALMLGVVAVVAGIAFLVSRRITDRVDLLAAAAERLARGDYETQVHLRTRDELQDLAEVFNAMGPKLCERERMKRSLALAQEIQQGLLPQAPPNVPGFDIEGRVAYCDETGGDYYDFIDLVDLGADQVGIALGDVTGHGIGAALLMASARGALRSHAGLHGGDLGKVLGALNRHLARDTGDSRFMTLFYCVLDGQKRELRWVSAGHDPALWLRRGADCIEELGSDGLVLGVEEDWAYRQSGPISLQSGDVVLIGTDGAWEARNAEGEMFGKQRFRDAFLAACDRPAAEICAALVEAVKAFRGEAPQEDDITLVAIKAL